MHHMNFLDMHKHKHDYTGNRFLGSIKALLFEQNFFRVTHSAPDGTKEINYIKTYQDSILYQHDMKTMNNLIKFPQISAYTSNNLIYTRKKPTEISTSI